MGVYRPGGVIALAIFFIIIAALGILGAIVIWAIWIPAEYQDFYWWVFGNIWLMSLGYPPIIVVGFASPMSEILRNIDYLNIFGVIVVIFSGLYITSGIGLLSMKNWARILAIILGILSIITGIFLFIIIAIFGFLIGILFLALGLATVVYLAGDVKYEFQ